jgi:hypothetical protein
MICPQCKGEYREGFTACATCEIPLIPGRSRHDYERAGGTPAVVAGLLIAVVSVGVLALRTLDASLYWYIGFLAVSIVIYLIRSRFRI